MEAEDDENDEDDELLNGNAEEIDVDEMMTNGNGHVVSADDGIQMEDAATINGNGVKASNENGSNVAATPSLSKQTSVETSVSIPAANGNGASISNLPPVAITQAILQKFNKQQQSSANLSTCSITTQMSATTTTRTATPSVCSSTGATVGTSFTLENSMSSSQFMRAKRKKNFNDYDDEEEDDDTDINYVDDNVSDNHTINDSLDTQMTGLGSSSNPINPDNTEIVTQQQIDTNPQ